MKSFARDYINYDAFNLKDLWKSNFVDNLVETKILKEEMKGGFYDSEEYDQDGYDESEEYIEATGRW